MVSNDEISRKLEEKKEGITLQENTKIEPKMNFCPNCGIKNMMELSSVLIVESN